MRHMQLLKKPKSNINMDELVQYFALFSLVFGVIYFSIIKMKKLGIAFVLVTYFKWFTGISITFFAFYVIHLSGSYLKENGFSELFSLPIGIFVWFVPMHYTTKIFLYLQERYK